MTIWRAVVMHTFGRGSQRPLRVAILRLGGLATAALCTGLLLMQGLASLPSSPTSSPWLVFTGIVTVQISILLTLLVSAGTLHTGKQDIFEQLIFIWPLPAAIRTTVLLLPTMLLAALALLLVGPPLGTVLTRLGLPVSLLPVALAIGTMSALGLARALPRRFLVTLLCLIPLTIGIEYKLLTFIMGISPTPSTRIAAACILSVILGICCLVLFTKKDAGNSHDVTASNRSLPLAGLGTHYWLIKKVLRNRATYIGFVITLVLSVIIATIGFHEHFDPSAFTTFAGLFVAAFCADIRSVSRRLNPAEITALRGTYHFMVAEIIGALTLGIVAVLPLIYLARLQGLAIVASTLFLGMTSGLLAGTFLVPAARDIMAQFLSTILAIALLMGLPALPPFQALTPYSTIIFQGIVTALLLVATYFIEYRRNAYTWRHHA